MEINDQSHILDVDPLGDVKTKRDASLAYMREKNRHARAQARAAGILPVVCKLPKHQLDALDELKRRAGLRNRSQAVLLILAALAAHPHLRQQLGL